MKQTIESKKGEIFFRKKLVKYQVEKTEQIEDELNSTEIENVLQERMGTTIADMNYLKSKDVNISFYVEIGAERCQRALVLENDFTSEGIAVDLSFDMLRSCDYYSRAFDKKNLPLRICCDANSLPFKNNSVPFIFTYSTLHHFPDPGIIVREIERVTSPGGNFFSGVEPVKQWLHIGLYDPGSMYSDKVCASGNLKKLIDYFFAKKHCTETRYDIVENDEISVADWKKAFGVFNIKEMSVHSLKYLNFDLNSKLQSWLAAMLGGMTKGLFQKPGEQPGEVKTDDILMCLLCKSDIVQGHEKYFCHKCGQIYPVRDNVVFMLKPESLQEFYPEFI